MKKAFVTLALALACTHATATATDIENTWYIGAGIGQNNYQSVSASSHLGDDSDLAWNAFVGYQLNKYFSIEAGWQDLGTNDDTHLWGETVGNEEINVDGFTLGVVGTLPLSDKWFLAGEVGGYQYHLSHQINANKYVSDTDIAAYFGVGVGYNITDSLAVSAKYRRFANIDETEWSTVNMDAQTIGVQLTYRFGVKPVKVSAVIVPAVIEKKAKLKYENHNEKSSVIVLFDFDSIKLSNTAKTQLDKIIRRSKNEEYDLKNKEQDFILLHGQSDNQGHSQYNLKLSEKRIQRVEEYLIEHGVEVLRIDKNAVGEREAHANTQKERALERRVIVTLTNKYIIWIP